MHLFGALIKAACAATKDARADCREASRALRVSHFGLPDPTRDLRPQPVPDPYP